MSDDADEPVASTPQPIQPDDQTRERQLSSPESDAHEPGSSAQTPAPQDAQGAGQTQPGGAQPTAPQQHPYYAHYSSPHGAYPREQTGRAARTLTGRSIAIIAAALVVGGLLGGGIGGGIAAAVGHGGDAPVTTTVSSGAANIVVKNPKNATQVTAVAAKASKSVVTINVTGQQAAGTGSGVILTSDGYILTNTHVVTLDGAQATVQIQVQSNDGTLYAAKVIGTDPTDDLAVIKLNNASGLTPISWGDSAKVNVGDQVIAIGAPLGLQGSVTDGIVSALNRSVTLQSSAPNSGNGNKSPFSGNPFSSGNQSSTSATISVPAVQTDAAINPGNSGGALLDDGGALIGINVAIASTGSSSGSGQSGNIGVGFAIPSSIAHRIANELIASGKATHGLLGATVSNAAAQSGATTVGARIESVSSGSAAGSAGLRAGDIVTNVNGAPVTSSDDLTAQVRSQASNSTVKVTYVRDGKTYQTDVTLGSYTA
jgi:putative serine protease PepD